MEKLANHIALQSIAEGGMEKKALNAAQLLRMGRNFTLRGKLDRFKALVDRRAQAASKVRDKREAAWSNAFNKHRQAGAYLRTFDANPASPELQLTSRRTLHDPIRIPRNPNPNSRHFDFETVDKDIVDDLDELLSYDKSTRDIILNGRPTYDSDQLATFSRALKQLDPKLREKALLTGSF